MAEVGNCRVLIIEDNESDYWQLRDCLVGLDDISGAQLRFRLSHVRMLSAGLTALRENAYELIFLDLTLPDASGVEALLSIIDDTPQASVIVMGTGCVDGLVVQAIENGARSYIIKGKYRASDLIAAIGQALSAFHVCDVDNERMSHFRAREAFQNILQKELLEPLSSIIEICKRHVSPFSPSLEDERALFMLRQSSRRLLSAVHQALAVSHPGVELMQKCDTRLLTLLRVVESFVRFKFAQRDTSFEISLHHPLPEAIHTDPVRLKQVLVNTIGAVLELSHGSPVVLNVFNAVSERQVVFQISERSMRPSEDQQREIMSALTASEDSVRVMRSGRFHNLGVARFLANRMGGDLSFEAQNFSGITFKVTTDYLA